MTRSGPPPPKCGIFHTFFFDGFPNGIIKFSLKKEVWASQARVWTRRINIKLTLTRAKCVKII